VLNRFLGVFFVSVVFLFDKVLGVSFVLSVVENPLDGEFFGVVGFEVVLEWYVVWCSFE
jgi:hypothetical protein